MENAEFIDEIRHLAIFPLTEYCFVDILKLFTNPNLYYGRKGAVLCSKTWEFG